MEHNAALFILCKQAAQHCAGEICPHNPKQLFDSCFAAKESSMNMLRTSKIGYISDILDECVCRFLIDAEEKK